MSEKHKKLRFFFKKVFFIEMFPWKHREQLGQPGRNFYDKKPNFSRSTFKHNTKTTKVSERYKMFLGTRRLRFWQHGRKNFKKWPKDSSSKSKNTRRKLLFSNKKISSVCSCEISDFSFGYPAKLWSTKGWNVVARNPNVMKRPLFIQKTFSSLNWSYGHVKGNVNNSTYEFFSAGSWSVFAQCPKL